MSIVLWSTLSRRLKVVHELHPDFIPLCLAFSPDSKRLASGDGSGCLTIWDVSKGRKLKRLDNCGGRVQECVWAPDGKTLATASGDMIIRVWTTRPCALHYTLESHTARVTLVLFSDDGRWLLSCASDGKCHFHAVDLMDDLPLELTEHATAVQQAAFDPTGQYIATGSDGTVRVWSVKDERESSVFSTEQTGPPLALSFSPHGMRVLWVGRRAALGIGDVLNGRMAVVDEGVRVRAACFSLDRTLVAVAMEDGSLFLLRTMDGSRVGTVSRDRRRKITCLAFSRDGETLLSGAKDGSVQIFWLAHLLSRRALIDATRFYTDSADMIM